MRSWNWVKIIEMKKLIKVEKTDTKLLIAKTVLDYIKFYSLDTVSDFPIHSSSMDNKLVRIWDP